MLLLSFSSGHGADYRSVVSFGSTCTLLGSVADEDAIWRLLVGRDFKAATALYRPLKRQEDVNATEKAESIEHS
jgi:hypothetical protein